MERYDDSENCITIGCTATDFPPLRGPKPAREPGVIRKRGIDWTVETASEFGSWAALDLSVTVFGPVAQDEGLSGRSGPTTDTHANRVSSQS